MINNLTIDEPTVPVVKSLPNITYHRSGTHELKMSLLIPQLVKPVPAILFLPGGGFRLANPNNFIQLRLALAQAGYLVASIEYQVLPAAFPAQLLSSKYALNYLVNHAAEFGLKRDQIAAVGVSAGGYLAQFLGVTSATSNFLPVEIPVANAKIWKVVSLFGFSDLTSLAEGLTNQTEKNSVEPILGLYLNGLNFLNDQTKVFTADPDALAEASPINYISEKNPPFLLMHGSKDQLISPNQLNKMTKALSAKHVAVTAIKVKGAEHGSWQWSQPIIAHQIIKWLNNK